MQQNDRVCNELVEQLSRTRIDTSENNTLTNKKRVRSSNFRLIDNSRICLPYENDIVESETDIHSDSSNF